MQQKAQKDDEEITCVIWQNPLTQHLPDLLLPNQLFPDLPLPAAVTWSPELEVLVNPVDFSSRQPTCICLSKCVCKRFFSH